MSSVGSSTSPGAGANAGANQASKGPDKSSKPSRPESCKIDYSFDPKKDDVHQFDAKIRQQNAQCAHDMAMLSLDGKDEAAAPAAGKPEQETGSLLDGIMGWLGGGDEPAANAAPPQPAGLPPGVKIEDLIKP